jgi:hypothetical protein
MSNLDSTEPLAVGVGFVDELGDSGAIHYIAVELEHPLTIIFGC